MHSRVDDQEIEISKAHGDLMWRIFLGYPTVRICRDLLHQYVFERPMIVEGPGAAAFDEGQWLVLARDILDSAMAVGIAVVRVKPGTMPTIIPWRLCRVTVTIDSKFNKVFRVYPTRMSDGEADVAMKDAVVLDMFGHSPTDRGEITSVMAPLRAKIFTILHQQDCMLLADRSRCQPTIFTETHDDSAKPAEEVQYDYYADSASLERNSANVFMRNKNALDELKAQQINVSSMFGSDGGAGEAVKESMSSIAPLPIGARMARAPPTESPEQIVERLRFLEQDIFVLLGVPRSFCMHDITGSG